MTIEAWGDRVAPDVPETLRRFPLAVVLAAAATLAILLLSNEVVPNGDETAMRAALGLGSAAVFAVAGVFFAESRPRNARAAVVFAYVVPAAVVLACQVRDTSLFVPYALPIIGALWLSVSAFTAGWRGPLAEEQQNRFWWLNHRAVASGAIAGFALAVIAIGIIAIERTLATLFGLDLGGPFYRTVLPILAFFFAPLYWLSSLPRLADYDPRVLDQPDFLARAVGLLGRFVLIPLLLAYGLILLAYVGQIAVMRQLPQGVLGWMVMGFVVAGAGTWLVLHPPFAGASAMVRFFRMSWFWLTLLPLGLFFVALCVRINAYGLTEERVLLGWGGVWAAVLAVAFLLRRGDTRLIPGLGALCLLLATVGPWNLENLPRWQQGLSLDLLLSRGSPPGEGAGVRPDWSPAQMARARGAITYLGATTEGKRELARVLDAHGFGSHVDGVSASTALSELDLIGKGLDVEPTIVQLSRDLAQPVDVSATPWLVTRLQLMSSYDPAKLLPGTDLTVRIEGGVLRVTRASTELAAVDLAPMVSSSGAGQLVQSTVDFAVDGRRFRFVADAVSFGRDPGNTDGRTTVSYIEGTLFSSTSAD